MSQLQLDLAALTGKPVVDASPLGGGSINAAWRVTLAGGEQVFYKSNTASEMFKREAEGLRALAAPEIIRIPKVIAVADDGLVLEHIETSAPRGGFFRAFGRSLAQLHRATRHDRCGFHHDNFIGSTPQPNTWEDDWPTFWAERRLGFQLKLAEKAGLATEELLAAGEKLQAALPELIGDTGEEPCLLHGDLWSGNYLVDAQGQPALIDPAAYYGHREADLAMTKLFGGFDGEFYAGYHEEWPLPPGSEGRMEIYKLYHLLNHLNLFGRGYLGSCMGTLERILRTL